ncbi:MAG: hypothetical protein P4L84_30685, partial [Isosphaeraceae bacterium]|nr:hypothetical protein [Isosphaeraceae bacterium]
IDEPRRFAVANIREIESLDEVPALSRHKALEAEIGKGIARCKAECGYFQVCGGGAPASKFYEHGTFDCTETRECRFAKQLLSSVLLEKATRLQCSG